MRTFIKAFLLVLSIVGAISGVLVFLKTQVAPPSSIMPIDQYGPILMSNSNELDAIDNFSQNRRAYINVDDKIRRFYAEGAISADIADAYRVKIDASYGNVLVRHGFEIFQKSIWPDSDLKQLSRYLDDLESDRLISGSSAVAETFKSSANTLREIIQKYHSAITLAKQTSFRSVSDASAKIQKAKEYKADQYLKNNTALMNDLNALPAKLGSSHYGYVNRKVDELNSFSTMSKQDFTVILIPSVDKALQEYKGTSIYGGNKPDVTPLEQQAKQIIQAAILYYNNSQDYNVPN